MNNLYEQFTVRHCREVLDTLSDSIAMVENNPLLQKLREGTLSLREFGFAAKVRLDAATNFVPFLSATEEKMRLDGQWADMSDALRKNLNEELGLEEGIKDNEKDHETWRRYFRSGLSRVLQREGISLQDIDDEEITDDVGIFYGERLKKMPVERSVPALAGAFTVLEGVLEKEFSAILSYIKSRVNGLTSEEIKYIAHHARHEHRHFDEAAIPLLNTCTTSPHIVPEVIKGIHDMTKWRRYHVLDQIDMNLWRASSSHDSSPTTK